MRTGRVLAFLVVLLFASTSAMAAGFRLPEAGAKAMGMGFAFTAQADDPSAIYFNPAGIVQLEGQNIKVGMTYVRENGADFSGETNYTRRVPAESRRDETQNDLDFFIPNLFWTKRASPDFAYGVGLFVPFGLGQKYGNSDTTIFRDQITQIELQTFVLNPTVAWKVNGVLSVGAGIDFMYGKAELRKTGVGFGPPFAAPGSAQNLFKVHLDGDGTTWGYNFGLLLTPSNNVKVGFSYRSPFRLKIKDGDVELTEVFPPLAGNPLFPPDSNAKATLNLPATAALGVAYIRDRLTLEVDADWTFWHSWKQLEIENKDSAALSSNQRKDWNDVVALYIGGEYRVTDPLALRLGFRYDPTPIPADTMGPELPDADRLYYCAGAGYKYRSLTFDLAYMYVDKKDRSVNNLDDAAPDGNSFNGTWKGDAHLVALDVGYRF